MKLAKYWTRETSEAINSNGRHVRATARGWSNDSMQAARSVARDIAQRLAQSIYPTRDRQYLYGDRPLPEPVLQEFQSAVVTRNVYGAEVLNTSDLMFIDVDKQPIQNNSAKPSALKMGLRAFFGKSPAPAEFAPPAQKDHPEVRKIQSVADRNNLTGRIYSTAAGYRVLITSSSFRPGDSAAEDMLRQFGSDPLYIRLCRLQESFRARLTPKPWRCGLRNPPVMFPFETPLEQSRFDAWEKTYAGASGRFATCRFMASFGSGRVVSGFEELVRYHDRETKAASSLPLA